MRVELELEFLEAEQVAPETKSFKFGLEGIEFHHIPGQYVSMLLDVDDPRGDVRSFSIASSPTERNYLMICTRITESPFKQKLNSMQRGTKVRFRGPFGRFTLEHEHMKQVVMLCGGIGITPFRSMIKFATDSQLQRKLLLLYSNRVPEEIVFREELEKWQTLNARFKLVNTITRPTESKEKWNGRVGRMDEKLISEFVDDSTNSLFYVCGPPLMVDGMLALFKGINVSDELVKREKFMGY